jgi:predicted NAD-dependent protein-ADP-ribosyltransferase YbiA (DUF1768 family)
MDFSTLLGVQATPQVQIPVELQRQPVAQPAQVQQAQISLTGGIRAPTPVFFLSEKDPATGYLSNDCYSPFFGTNGGERYISAQQYIAQKRARAMKDFETEDKIMEITLTDEQAKNPDVVSETMKKIKDLANEVKNFDKALWDQVKVGVFSQGLFYKFSQNPALLLRFMATQNDLLFFADADKELGIGFDEPNARQIAGSQWNVTIFSVDQIAKFYDQYSINLLGKVLMDVRQKFREFGIPPWAVTLSEEAKAAIARRAERAAQPLVIQNNNNDVVQKVEPEKVIQKSVDDSADYPPIRVQVDEDSNHREAEHEDTSSHSEEDVPVEPLDLKAILSAPAPVLSSTEQAIVAVEVPK